MRAREAGRWIHAQGHRHRRQHRTGDDQPVQHHGAPGDSATADNATADDATADDDTSDPSAESVAARRRSVVASERGRGPVLQPGPHGLGRCRWLQVHGKRIAAAGSRSPTTGTSTGRDDAGSSTFTITVTDKNGATGRELDVDRHGATARCWPVVTPGRERGPQNYNQQFTASGGAGDYKFAASGSLPPGLWVSNGGQQLKTDTLTTDGIVDLHDHRHRQERRHRHRELHGTLRRKMPQLVVGLTSFRTGSGARTTTRRSRAPEVLVDLQVHGKRFATARPLTRE